MGEQPPKRLIIHNNAARDKTRLPQTQLVGRKRYLTVITTKGFLYSFAAVFGCGGVLALLASLLIIVVTTLFRQQGDNVLGSLTIGACVAAAGIAAIAVGKEVVSEVKEMDPIQLITRQNTHLLPARTTLVRAADAPASDPQAELLRAAGQGQETPADQLLRAGEESRHDV